MQIGKCRLEVESVVPPTRRICINTVHQIRPRECLTALRQWVLLPLLQLMLLLQLLLHLLLSCLALPQHGTINFKFAMKLVSEHVHLGGPHSRCSPPADVLGENFRVPACDFHSVLSATPAFTLSKISITARFHHVLQVKYSLRIYTHFLNAICISLNKFDDLPLMF